MATLSITLAIGALLVGAVSDLLYRVGQKRGIDAGAFLFWQSLVFTAVLWTASFVTGDVWETQPETWLYGLPGGLMSYVGLYLFVLSLRTGDASVNAPVFRLNFVITGTGAIILLHEPVNAAKVAGTLLAVVSVASLLNPASLRDGGAARQSLVMVVAASLLFGAVGILAKHALNEGSGAIPLILTQTVAFQTGATVYVLATRRWRPNDVTVRFAPGIALLQLAWSVMLFQSLALGDASVSYPIVQLSFVLTAVLAVLFLGEAMSRAKAGGLALAVIAVGALALA
jgi:uncharacterized membrane protein